MPKILLNVSHRRQHPQSAECLPVCVAMALDYLGRPIKYETLLLHDNDDQGNQKYSFSLDRKVPEV
jgi:hypothetical protein